MMLRRCFRFAPVLAALVPLACSDPVEPSTRETTAATSPTLASLFLSKAAVRTIDDEFEALEHRAPGFGGLYVDSAGSLKVYVKGSGAAAVLEEVRRAIAAGTPANVAQQLLSHVEVTPASYDYSQLRAWYRQAAALHADSRVVFTDIAEERNRIVVGIAPDASASDIMSMLARWDIPAAAVSIEAAAPTNISSTLGDLVRPTVAGLRIAGSAGLCTLGYNASKAVGTYPKMTLDLSKRYFLTAAHCTPVFGAVSVGAMGQPTQANTIGYELVDPPLITSAQDARCPQGRQCRYSDAVLFEYAPSVSMQLQGIARTSGLTITGTDSIVNINSCPYWCVLVGWSQDRMVGATNGTQTGTVQSVCADVKQFNAGVDTGRTMLCQTRAGYTSGGGDSGAPVVSSNSDANKTLQGIHWGTSVLEGGGPIFATYSLAQQAHRESFNASGIIVAPCPGSGCFLWY